MTTIIFLLLSIFTPVSSEQPNKHLIIFSADWCDYCNKAKNDIEKDNNHDKILSKYGIMYVDYDNNKEIVNIYKIEKIPTFIILDNHGNEIKRKVGYKNITDLLHFLINGGE